MLGNLGGTALVCREGLAPAIVCGGSLVRRGSAGPCAVDLLMKDWVLKGGLEAFAPDHEIEVGVVPAKQSVPAREYEALAVARAGFGTVETATTIMAAAREAYGLWLEEGPPALPT